MKSLRTLLFTCLIFFTFITVVKAVQLNPSSGNLAVGVTQTVNLTATPPSNSSTVQVRLTMSGPGQITGYTAPAGNFITVFGSCPGGVGFTSTTVCADISKTGGPNLVTGDPLGSFTFTTTGNGTITVTKDSNNGYLVGSTIQPDTSGGGTYTVSSSGSSTPLPNTGIADDFILVLIGTALIAFGVSLRIKRK